MLDTITKEKRSEIMSKVRSKNTSPELAVRKLVFSLGYRYRLHAKNLPGKPDLVFSGRKKVIFVHGCFWHGHDCTRGSAPATNKEFWLPKLEKNKVRDAETFRLLNSMSWSVLVIWQCQMKDEDDLKTTIINFLNT
ncbi:MAG: very short patch repair endonuclease [Nitrosomonas sp.]|nr:very short patch repair endonuclease [Nitrosomonas sp.]